MLVAGDELLFTKVLTSDELSRYQKVYVPGELVIEGPQMAVVEAGLATGRVVPHQSMKQVLSQITPLMEVLESGGDLLALPRRKTEGGQTEIALHLLNRNFSQAADDVRPLGRVRLFVHDSLLAGIDHPTFELHTPEPTHQGDPTVRRAANRPGYVVEAPNLAMWAILRISG